MSASGHQDRIELMIDIHQYFRRVGMISDFRELAWLGFDMGIYLSIFSQHLTAQLLTFCRENPEYHVVTSVDPGRWVNKYVPDCRCYKLANGDKNPNLVLNPLVSPERALVDEEVICSALTMLNNTDAGD